MNEFYLSLLLLGGLNSQSGTMPFLATANQYDVAPRSSGATALLQTGMKYNEEKTFQWHWGVSAGLRSDCWGPARFIPDEAYAGIKWKVLSLDLGLKRKAQDYLACGDNLGTMSITGGNMIWSGNSATMPGYTLRLHPWGIPGTANHLRIFGDFCDWVTLDRRYMNRALVHNTHAGINGDPAKWLTITIGLDHYSMWGGTSPENVKFSTSFKNYLRMVTGQSAVLGDGYSEGDVVNILGNHLGREYLRLDFKGNGWKLAFQHDHPYEDRSGMRFQNFPDGVYTLAFNLEDKKKWVNGVIYEFCYTMWQGGDCERRAATPEEIAAGDPHLYKEPAGSCFGEYSYVGGGADNYFSNYEYCSGWTYAGRTLGLPLIWVGGTLEGSLNPNEMTKGIECTRIIAHNAAITGMIARKIPYKLQLVYSVNYGLYPFSRMSGGTGIYHFGNDWTRYADQMPFRQFSAAFKCEIPLLRNRLRVIPGIYWDHGQVLKKCFAATIGVKYAFFD